MVSAPASLQRARVLRRPGMTEARLAAILAQQMPDAEKRRRARWVVPTGLGQAVTLKKLKAILREVGASFDSPPPAAAQDDALWQPLTQDGC